MEEEEEPVVSLQQGHVLAIPFPAQGHINPLMRLCQRLAARGFKITFVNIEPIHNRIKQAAGGSDHPKNAAMIHTVHIPLAAAATSSHELKDFRLSLRSLVEAVEGLAGPLHHMVGHLADSDSAPAANNSSELLSDNNNNTPPFTCIICDVFASSVVQPLAAEFGLPWLALFPSCQARHLVSLYVARGFISVENVLKAKSKPASDVFCERVALPGLLPLQNIDLPMYTHVVDDTKYIYDIGIRECHIAFERSNGIVINSLEVLEEKAFGTMRSLVNTSLYSVGPLVEKTDTSLWPEENHCLDWLEKQPTQSILYISFGTITILSEIQFKEIIQGLQSCNQRFLWVLRPDLVEGDILKKYNGVDGLGYFVRWAPQVHVLSHSAIGGFLTHCGWNSTMEAIAYGVPLICWPYFGDQHIIAKYIVEEWKIGMRLFPIPSTFSKVFVTRSQVEKVVKSFMQGDVGQLARINISKLKKDVDRNQRVGGTSYNMLNDLIRSLQTKKTNQIQGNTYCN